MANTNNIINEGISDSELNSSELNSSRSKQDLIIKAGDILKVSSINDNEIILSIISQKNKKSASQIETDSEGSYMVRQ